MNCLNCNQKISSKNKFCSNKCQKEYEYKNYIERWKSNQETGLRGEYQISMHIKTYLFKKYNFVNSIIKIIKIYHKKFKVCTSFMIYSILNSNNLIFFCFPSTLFILREYYCIYSTNT